MVDTASTTETPRARRYKFRANAQCGRMETGGPGAFNGSCLVFEGDEFFMTLSPALVKARDKDGRIVRDAAGRAKTVLADRALPTWADPIAEYPLEREPQPLRVIAGEAPAAAQARPAPVRSSGPANPNQHTMATPRT